MAAFQAFVSRVVPDLKANAPYIDISCGSLGMVACYYGLSIDMRAIRIDGLRFLLNHGRWVTSYVMYLTPREKKLIHFELAV